MAIHPDNEEAFQTIDAAMFSGCPDEEFLQRLEYFMGRWTREIPMAREINAEVEADLEDDDDLADDGPDGIKFGNQCTGDITNVRQYLDAIQVGNDNWIKGIKGKFKICAKVFSVGSSFGIKDGRISKLQICDISQPHWGVEGTYVSYDRGWDVRPSDPEALEFLNGLLEAFGDSPLVDDDLIGYDLYLYDSVADFEEGNREHAGSFDSMRDALSEGRYYIEEGSNDPRAVIKVISNDDEEIEIIHRGRFPSDSDEVRQQLDGVN